MNAEKLKAAQTPLKALYKEDPQSAQKTLSVRGEIGSINPVVSINTHIGLLEAGMHPATGGSGKEACSGDMLLEALAACSGVTLKAVAIAMGIEIRKASVIVEGDLDFRGTLGISKEVPVGFSSIRLRFEVDSDATDQQLDTLQNLAERYCVIYQTLKKAPELIIERTRVSA